MLETPTYVDLSKKHIVVCRQKILQIFSRATRGNVVGASSTCTIFRGWECYVSLDNMVKAFPFKCVSDKSGIRDSRMSSITLWPVRSTTYIPVLNINSSSHFLLWIASCCITRNFKASCHTTFNVLSAVRNHCMVYILYKSKNPLSRINNTPPNVRVSRALSFNDPSPSRLATVTCLQMTGTVLFLTWIPDPQAQMISKQCTKNHRTPPCKH